MITINMTKAREIHRNRLREARGPALADLDTQFMRALESGDTVSQAKIAKAKQALRDVTKHPDIAKAKTPEQLKAVWPDVLQPN